MSFAELTPEEKAARLAHYRSAEYREKLEIVPKDEDGKRKSWDNLPDEFQAELTQ